MKYTIKTIITILSLILCIEASYAQDDFSDRKLIVRGCSDYPPYEYINGNGENTGFNVELIEAIMREAGFDYEIVLKPWLEIRKELEEGEVDLLMGMYFTHQRDTKFHFGIPHNYNFPCLISKKGDTYNDINSIKGKRILIQKGDEALRDYLSKRGLSDGIIESFNIETVINALIDGTGDVAIFDKMVARHFMISKDISNIEINNVNLPILEYCYVSNNSHLIEQLNHAFLKVKSKGIYDNIYNKWFKYNKKEKYLNYLYFVVILLLVLALISVLFSMELNKRVKIAKKKAEENGERYKTIFENTIVGLRYYSSDGVLVDLNTAEINIFGIKDKKVFLEQKLNIFENPYLTEIINKDNPQPYHGVIEFDFKTLQYHPYHDITTVRKILFIDTRIVPIRDSNGEITAYIRTSVDVTEREKREMEMSLFNQRVKEINRRTEYAIKAANIIFWEYDVVNNVFNAINDPINNYNSNIPISEGDYYRTCNPDDRVRLIPSIELMKNGINKSFNINIRFKTNYDSEWRHCTVSGTPFDTTDDGEVIRYVGTRKDNNEIIKLNEEIAKYGEKMKHIIKSSNITTWDYDFRTKVISIDSNIDFFPKKAAFEEYIKHLPIEEQDDFSNVIKDLVAGKIQSFSHRRTIYPKIDDHSIVLHTIISGIAVKNEFGITTGCSGLLRDVTELIEIQKRLEKEKQNAENADKLKSVFLANMSHEIRTPLNAIVGFSRLLQSSQEGEEKGEFVKIIETNNDILINLINDILDLSKIESGILELSYEKFDIIEILKDVEVTMLHKNTNPDLNIKFSYTDIELIVNLDRQRVSQIINNFVSNALKYTPKGEIHIWYEKVDNGIKIYSKDTGIGIAEENLPFVFSRFEKLDKFAQGTGLGLAISRALCDAMGGKIGVESKLNVGSTFWCWLPIN